MACKKQIKQIQLREKPSIVLELETIAPLSIYLDDIVPIVLVNKDPATILNPLGFPFTFDMTFPL